MGGAKDIRAADTSQCRAARPRHQGAHCDDQLQCLPRQHGFNLYLNCIVQHVERGTLTHISIMRVLPLRPPPLHTKRASYTQHDVTHPSTRRHWAHPVSVTTPGFRILRSCKFMGRVGQVWRVPWSHCRVHSKHVAPMGSDTVRMHCSCTAARPTVGGGIQQSTILAPCSCL